MKRETSHSWETLDGLLRSGYLDSVVGESFNLASGRETKVLDLAHLVNRLTENAEGVVFQEKRDWDKSTRRRASIDKAEKLLNFHSVGRHGEGSRPHCQMDPGKTGTEYRKMHNSDLLHINP